MSVLPMIQVTGNFMEIAKIYFIWILKSKIYSTFAAAEKRYTFSPSVVISRGKRIIEISYYKLSF